MFWRKLTREQRKSAAKFSFVAMLAVFVIVVLVDSCSKKDIDLENLNLNIDSAYTMRTVEVDMLISDSGLVRHRLVSPEWLIYDNNQRRAWLFPKGLRIETYDTIQEGKTLIVADSAIQHLDTETWELIGNVQASGLKGERLLTPHLYWNRREHKLYSNDTTYFHDETGDWRGDHFEAKDDLSKYDIYYNSGDIEIQEDNNQRPPQAHPRSRMDSLRQPLDTLQQAVEPK